jgi:hypothetical protein
MIVADTKPLEKICSKCLTIKLENMFILKRNICKECRNNNSRQRYKALEIKNIEQECNFCNKIKLQSLFVKNRKICIECNNSKRRLKYENDENHRNILIQKATEFKQKKILEKHKKIEEELGIDNKKCEYCENIKHKSRFRNNRLKCKDCERDEPIEKLKRIIRSRIISAIHNKNKHTVEYLGCNISEYLNWLLKNNFEYTLENRGTEWHIDHVIPLSHFNLKNEEEQLVAFNWRNTMPLSCKENLSKNNKIIKSQIEQHYKKLVEYHIENNIHLPQVYIDLFAKHLDDGKPLKLSLPLADGNISKGPQLIADPNGKKVINDYSKV